MRDFRPGETPEEMMWSFQVSPEDLLCPICLELFDEPKSLPCLHTFCQECISDHITVRHCDTAVIDGGFPCPTCRQHVAIQDARKPLTDWASQLQTNFFIKNVIKNQDAGVQKPKPAPESHDETKCETHTTKERDMICVDCSRQICAMCAFETHRGCKEVYTLEQAITTKKEEIQLLLKGIKERQERDAAVQDQISTSKQVLKMDKLSALQKIERSEKLLMSIIKEASNKGRSLITAKHDEAAKFLESEENTSKAVRAHLSKVNSSAEKLLADMSSQRSQGIDQYKDVTKQLKTWVSQLGEMVDSKQNPCSTFQLEFLPIEPEKWHLRMGEVKLMKIKNTTELPAVSSVTRSVPSPVTPTAPPTEITEETSRQANVQSVPLVQHAAHTVGPMRSPNAQAPRVTGGQGQITTVPIQNQLTQPSPVLPTSVFMSPGAVAEYTKKTPVKIKEDKNKPKVRDITIIPGHVIVLTDGGNKAVKSFYKQGSEQLYSRYVTLCQPHGVSQLSGSVVVVTLPNEKEIILLNVTPNIFLQKRVTTSKKYWAVTAVSTETLAVTVCPGASPPEIEFINLQGTILGTFKCCHLANPLYMCCTPREEIVVADPTVQCGILCLARTTGRVKFKYGPKQQEGKMTRVMGLTVDKSGFILALDQDTSTVHLLDPEGHWLRQLISPQKGNKNMVGLAIQDNTVVVCTQESMLLEYSVVPVQERGL